jgi:hypothetical protein
MPRNLALSKVNTRELRTPRSPSHKYLRALVLPIVTLDMAVTSVDHNFTSHFDPDRICPGQHLYRTWTKSFGLVVQIRTSLLDYRYVQAFSDLSLLRA